MLRLSTGLMDHLMGGGSLKQAFTGGRLCFYSGSQPATADTAYTGTLLAQVSLASATWSAETAAYGIVNFTGGGSGSLNTLTVNGVDVLGGAVTYSGSLANTMVLVAAQVNAKNMSPHYKASIPVAGVATMWLTAGPGLGTDPNGYVVAHTETTITVTETNVANGVAGANGLTFSESASGTLSLAGTWSGLILATATVGWFRLYGPGTDAGGASTSLMRIDGAVLADMDMTNTTLTSGKTLTIDRFNLTCSAY